MMISVALVLSLVGSVVVLRFPAFRLSTPDVRPGYTVNEVVDVPSEVFDGRRYTVLLFGESTCGACEQSIPLFAHLRSALSASSLGFHLVGISSDRGLNDYASRLGLKAPDVIALDPSKQAELKLAGVPTLLLVDRSGTILLQHVGRPTEPELAQILRAIQAKVAS